MLRFKGFLRHNYGAFATTLLNRLQKSKEIGKRSNLLGAKERA
jgi:hypothetical protein